mgnify:CR=1 FL=1
MNATEQELLSVKDVGPVVTKSILLFVNDSRNIKLLNELDKSIPPNGQMIEGLIGLHLMVLSSKLGIINNDNLEYFEYLIGLYENENYINNSHFLEVVKNMGVISKKIFDKFWEKPKRISKKRK